MGIEPARAEYTSINRARHYKKKKLLSMGFEPARAKNTSSGSWTDAASRRHKYGTVYFGII